mmetsp:Transcript_28840/g.85145  ORF Transcript_28840/g.85145 Transcript_28840/m.85145 type:complete len:305 (-) Transcript_28840:1434-2348(-)
MFHSYRPPSSKASRPSNLMRSGRDATLSFSRFLNGRRWDNATSLSLCPMRCLPPAISSPSPPDARADSTDRSHTANRGARDGVRARRETNLDRRVTMSCSPLLPSAAPPPNSSSSSASVRISPRTELRTTRASLARSATSSRASSLERRDCVRSIAREPEVTGGGLDLAFFFSTVAEDTLSSSSVSSDRSSIRDDRAASRSAMVLPPSRSSSSSSSGSWNSSSSSSRSSAPPLAFLAEGGRSDAPSASPPPSPGPSTTFPTLSSRVCSALRFLPLRSSSSFRFFTSFSSVWIRISPVLRSFPLR